VEDNSETFAPLNDEINEVYLWHGTHVRAAIGIAQNDFRINLAGTGAGTMYGRGVYMAESCTKADEYTKDEPGGYYDKIFALVLCRVVMGKYFYTMERDMTAEAKVREGEFDSTCGDRKKLVGTFREFVVYDNSQLYPEYVVLVSRVLRHDDVNSIRRQAAILFHMELPVYWHNCHKDPRTESFKETYDVRPKTCEMLQRLVDGCCGASKLIVSARRIEDSSMWNRYMAKKLKILAKRTKCTSPNELDGKPETGHVLTEKLLWEDEGEASISLENLNSAANELILWHGTNKPAALAITRDGFKIPTNGGILGNPGSGRAREFIVLEDAQVYPEFHLVLR